MCLLLLKQRNNNEHLVCRVNKSSCKFKIFFILKLNAEASAEARVGLDRERALLNVHLKKMREGNLCMRQGVGFMKSPGC